MEALGRVQRSGAVTEELLERWIGEQPPDKPVFAFLHLYEPHSPYEPPEPFKSRYAHRPYDGEIAAADAIVGRFLGFLKSKQIYDKAIVVFLSDHGEGLGDHGEDEHGIFLYREALRVPLFVKLPGGARAGERIGSPVGLVDVFPTVAALLGEKVPFPAGRGAGSRVRGPARRERRLYAETLYPRLHFGWSDLASLTDRRYQFIEAPRPELYDWTHDPGGEGEPRRDAAAGLPIDECAAPRDGTPHEGAGGGGRGDDPEARLARLPCLALARRRIEGSSRPERQDPDARPCSGRRRT
jgi:choline-sulfatase